MKYRNVIVLFIQYFVLIYSNLYDGYKVFDLHPQTIFQKNVLEIIAQKNNKLDFWIKRNARGENWTVMVPPTVIFNQYMDQFYKIDSQEIISNVAELIYTKNETNEEPEQMSFNKYHDIDTIYNYLTDLSDNNPNLVTIFNIGPSSLNESILAVQISNGNGENKPSILICSGLSGREWIGPATALYIIDQLVNNYNELMYLNVDWYIIPLLNPDGYDYTRTTDRMWQKNRSGTNKSECMGVDITKNFNFHWGESGSGTSNQCKLEYIGPYPASESEIKALFSFMHFYGNNTKLYLSLHAFGPMLLYPWTYISDPIENELEQQLLGEEFSDAIYNESETKYKVGSYITEMYPAGGVDTDWMKGKANISLVYSLHMPKRGSGMFDPVEEEIEGVVKEVFKGIVVFQKYVEEKWAVPNDELNDYD